MLAIVTLCLMPAPIGANQAAFWTDFALGVASPSAIAKLPVAGSKLLRGGAKFVGSLDAAADAVRAANHVGPAAETLARAGRSAADEALEVLGTVGAACNIRNSFTPDTLVLMADGSEKPISKIQIGDWVMAEDPETGERGPRQVTALIRGTGTKELVDIELGEDGIGVGPKLTATDQHPFWVVSRNAWVDAADLRVGDVLLTDSGQTVLVEHVTRYSVAVQTVHNLTV